MPQECRGRLHRAIDGDRRGRLAADAREVAQLAGDGEDARDVAADRHEALVERLAADAALRLQDLQHGMDGGERIRHLVADAGEHEAEGGEPLCLRVHRPHDAQRALADPAEHQRCGLARARRRGAHRGIGME